MGKTAVKAFKTDDELWFRFRTLCFQKKTTVEKELNRLIKEDLNGKV